MSGPGGPGAPPLAVAPEPPALLLIDAAPPGVPVGER